MDVPTTPPNVHQAVRQTFAELGLDQIALAGMEESLLVRDGRYCARTYAAGGLFAMWMIDVRLVQFYGPGGQMLRTIDLAQDPQKVRRAA
jgi:hypothetical protein